jgi:DNA (cytosine-5)-methyltransferase 1
MEKCTKLIHLSRNLVLKLFPLKIEKVKNEMQHITHFEGFGGIGALSEALRRTGKGTTIAYCDICKHAQQVYRQHFPTVPIYSDIREYHPPQGVDLFTFGFPCTGTSQAGGKKGLDHKESNLWFEALRIIREGSPRFVIIENPTGLLEVDRGMGIVLRGLSESGYDAEWQTISAKAFGSPQKRERVFIIAYPNDRDWSRACCWSDQMRESIKRQRLIARYPKFESSSDGYIIRVPAELGDVPIAIPKKAKGRNDIRKLFGRTIDLNCAAIAIERVLYLDNIIEFPRCIS